MTALVTGATGFVGSHVVDALLAEGLPVRALVRNASKAGDLPGRGVEVVVGDMADPEIWITAVQGASTIYHCAAATDKEMPPWQAYDANLIALRSLLDTMRRTGAGRLVLPTGLSVLGVRSLPNATEDLPCRRRGDPDIDAKVEAEELALQYHERHGLDVTILRPSFIYGPRDQRNLPSLLNAIREGKFVYLGSRQNIVPLVHVQDMAQAMLLAGRSACARGRIYHVADGSRTTIEEIVLFLASYLAVEPPRRLLPAFLAKVACHLCAQLVRCGCLGRAPLTWSEVLFVGTSRFVDIRRAREELGFAPRVCYREGMATALEWVKEKANQSPQPSPPSTSAKPR
jgi:nucleoside-diphosphate-sugar epimerase